MCGLQSACLQISFWTSASWEADEEGIKNEACPKQTP